MKARRAYRQRRPSEVAVLDALVERGSEGMTVLELRAAVDADIDAIEAALSSLQADGLITVSAEDGTTRIKPDERVVPGPDDAPDEPSLLDRLRGRLPF